MRSPEGLDQLSPAEAHARGRADVDREQRLLAELNRVETDRNENLRGLERLYAEQKALLVEARTARDTLLMRECQARAQALQQLADEVVWYRPQFCLTAMFASDAAHRQLFRLNKINNNNNAIILRRKKERRQNSNIF